MTTTTDYTPPEHMAPAADGFLVAVHLYATAKNRWEDAGKPRGDGDPLLRAMAWTLIAIGGLHDGWLSVDQLDGMDPNDLDGFFMEDRKDRLPSKEQVPALTATAKQWHGWVRENYVPRVREFAINAGIPWEERTDG